MYDFTDSVVLITGGSRGIGLAIAEHFGKAKAKVIILEEIKRAWITPHQS